MEINFSLTVFVKEYENKCSWFVTRYSSWKQLRSLKMNYVIHLQNTSHVEESMFNITAKNWGTHRYEYYKTDSEQIPKILIWLQA
jgi:hypothetical protein